MSPRAACRLEQLGFEAYDYGGGKMDWLSFALPYEGDADLVGTRLREVPSVGSDATIGEARRLRDDAPGSMVVVTDDDVVLGLLDADTLEAEKTVTVSELMVEGPTTVRPSEGVTALAHRMERAGAESVLVTRPDGRLLGAFTP